MTAALVETGLNEKKFEHKLWLSMLGAPVLWLIYLQTVYALVQKACTGGQPSILHITSGFFLAVTLLVGGISFAQWKNVGKGWPSDDEGTRDGRRRAMAMIGFLQSGLFALLIITSWAAVVILDPCQNISHP